MYARATATGHIVPEHRPPEKEFVVPAHELAHEASQLRMLEEVKVLGRRV